MCVCGCVSVSVCVGGLVSVCVCVSVSVLRVCTSVFSHITYMQTNKPTYKQTHVIVYKLCIARAKTEKDARSNVQTLCV